MITYRDRIRLRMACRPVLGLLIRGRAVPIPRRVGYVLRDTRTGAYVTDPYGTDRRRFYSGRISDAYRFTRSDLAERVADEIGGTLVVVAVPLSELEPP